MDTETFLGGRKRNQPTNVLPEPIFNKFAGKAIISLNLSTATTNDPVGSFPVALFLSAFQDSYAALITGIPAGYSLVVTQTATGVVFTYTESTNVFAITVASPTQNYRAVLNRFINARYKVSLTRMAVTNSASSSTQFSQGYEAVSANVLGRTDRNPLDIDTAQSPNNFQDDIIEMAQEYILGPEDGIILDVAETTSAIQLNLTSSEYDLP